MHGAAGVELRAPKAGALPGCATPRQYVRPNYRALRRFLAVRINKWGAVPAFHGSRRKDGQLASLFAAFGGHILRAKADTYLVEKSCRRLASRKDPYVIVRYSLR